jgi:DNA-binding NarL/FixJ family response regulator
MIDEKKKELVKRQLQVGRVKMLVDKGWNTTQIAAELKLPESVVRAHISDINLARENMEKMNVE